MAFVYDHHEEIQIVFTQKHNFNSRNESNSLTSFGKVWTIKVRKQGTSKVFQKHFALKKVRRSIETLNDEIKAVVTDKHRFYNRQESFLITLFWKLWTVKKF